MKKRFTDRRDHDTSKYDLAVSLLYIHPDGTVKSPSGRELKGSRIRVRAGGHNFTVSHDHLILYKFALDDKVQLLRRQVIHLDNDPENYNLTNLAYALDQRQPFWSWEAYKLLGLAKEMDAHAEQLHLRFREAKEQAKFWAGQFYAYMGFPPEPGW